MGEEKRLDVAIGRFDRVRVPDERAALSRDSLGTVDPRLAIRRRLSRIASSMKRVMTRRVSS